MFFIKNYFYLKCLEHSIYLSLIKNKIINTAMTPILFITYLHCSLPLTVCGVNGESGFCQRLSVCMPLLHCMAKRKFIHISRHWHWPIRTGGGSKNLGEPLMNFRFPLLNLVFSIPANTGECLPPCPLHVPRFRRLCKFIKNPDFGAHSFLLQIEGQFMMGN